MSLTLLSTVPDFAHESTSRVLSSYDYAGARRDHDMLGKEHNATVAGLIDAVSNSVKRIGIDCLALPADFYHSGGVCRWNDFEELGGITAKFDERVYIPDQIDKLWSGTLIMSGKLRSMKGWHSMTTDTDEIITVAMSGDSVSSAPGPVKRSTFKDSSPVVGRCNSMACSQSGPNRSASFRRASPRSR